MRTQPWLAIAFGARLQIAVDDQGRCTAHELLEDIVLAIHRHPADAGQHVRNDNAIALGEVMQRLRGNNLWERKHAERSSLLRVHDPAEKETRYAVLAQPASQRTQVRRPFVALRVENSHMAQGAMKLTAQTGDERRVAPTRFELAAMTDRRAAGKDLAIGGLQCVERDLQAHPQQPARQA